MPKTKALGKTSLDDKQSSTTGTEFKAAEYNEVAMNSSLIEIRLLKSSFLVEPDFYAVQDETKLSFGRETVSCSVDSADNTVAAIFKYNVLAKQGRSKLLRCEAEYVVIYEVKSVSPHAAMAAFCRNVGAFAAYPYFRALVSQLTWGAGVTLPPLPAIASTAHIPRKGSAQEGG
jgi:preprotein translocase subunit SecB